MVQIVGIVCKNEHVRIDIRTPRNTTLHHPSTHSDIDTDQKHTQSLHFRTHLDQPRNCLFCLSRISVCALLNLCWVVAGLGDSGELRVVGQVGFHTFYLGNVGRRNNATPSFRDTPCEKGGRVVRRPIFEPLFTTHPSEVGSTSPWTLLAAMMRGPLSPDLSPSDHILWGFERDSRYHRLCNLDSPITCQQMCHLFQWLPVETN